MSNRYQSYSYQPEVKSSKYQVIRPNLSNGGVGIIVTDQPQVWDLGRVAEGGKKRTKGNKGKQDSVWVARFLCFWTDFEEMVLILEDFTLPDLH